MLTGFRRLPGIAVVFTTRYAMQRGAKVGHTVGLCGHPGYLSKAVRLLHHHRISQDCHMFGTNVIDGVHHLRYLLPQNTCDEIPADARGDASTTVPPDTA